MGRRLTGNLRFLIATAVAGLAVLSLAIPAFAQRFSFIPEGEDRIPCPQGYVYEREISTVDLSSPEDLFIDARGRLHVADTGNNRIVRMDASGALLEEIRGPSAGRMLSAPQGVFVTGDGTVYVADTGNYRIVVFGPDGSTRLVIERPRSHLFRGEMAFTPTKLVVDRRGFIYATNKDDYRGILVFDGEGKFRGFFGSNPVDFNWRALFIRLFATKAQKERIARDLPPPHSNVTIDDQGYIYSSTYYDTKNQIKKLSPAGVDVYNKGLVIRYGERRRAGNPAFVDVAVDDQGIISALDSGTGQVYQYDQDRHLLLLFGTKGDGKSQFKQPSSIFVDSARKIYVLDKDIGVIKVFRPTHFATLVHTASQLYYDGRYAEAEAPWREVIRLNSNYSLAHTGIGKAALKRGDLETAMAHFRYAKDYLGYSSAFAKLRYRYLREHFASFMGWVGILIALFVAARWTIGRVMARPREKSGWIARFIQLTFNMITSPFETFLALKAEAPVAMALVMVGLAVAARVFTLRVTGFQLAQANLFEALSRLSRYQWTFTGFYLGHLDPAEISIVAEAVKVLLPWALWAIANYGVSTIHGGEGFFRDILVGSAFSMAPYVVFAPPLALLTNVGSWDERGLFVALWWVIALWVVFLVFNQVRVMHNYEFREACWVSLVTIFGMSVLIGAGGLAYSLTGQMVTFAREVAVELSIR
ncbi:MAG: hypothetical protein ACM3ZU_04795 [Bacteroidota bacterium]